MFSHIPLRQRNSLLGLARFANCRIVMDAQQESTNEKFNRAWRRWENFCRREYCGVSPLLEGVSNDNAALLLKSFFELLRKSKFNVNGSFQGYHQRRMAILTIKGTASSLSSAFRLRIRRNPLHCSSNQKVKLVELTNLFNAFKKISPSSKQQKVLTPKFR